MVPTSATKVLVMAILDGIFKDKEVPLTGLLLTLPRTTDNLIAFPREVVLSNRMWVVFKWLSTVVVYTSISGRNLL